MRSRPTSLLLLLSASLTLIPAALAAQSFPRDTGFWEITPQVGFFVSEEPEDTEIEGRPIFGARAGWRRWTGFGFEVHGFYTPLELELEGSPPEAIDMPTFLYGAEVLYGWGPTRRTDVFAALGLGGITYSPDREDDEPGEGLDSETNLRLSLGLGGHVLIGSSVAVRADLRDHIIFDQLADTALELGTVDQGNTNNLEGSLGVSFLLD